MEKVVYVLGAGFSAPLGLPVMSNFREKAQDLRQNHPERFGRSLELLDDIREINEIKSYYQADLFNIEEILSILTMQDYLNGTDRSGQFRKFLADVVVACTPPIEQGSLEDGRPNPSSDQLYGSSTAEGWQRYCAFAANLVNLQVKKVPLVIRELNDPELVPEYSLKRDVSTSYSVVTLNYDQVIEKAVGHVATQNWKPKGSRPELFRTIDDLDDKACGIGFAQLHGGIDPLTIVPPTWQKGAEIEAPIRAAWQLARRLLNEANHIRIIGYSLPESDVYVKYLLKVAVLGAENLKSIDVICLVGSDVNVRDRYQTLIDLRKFRFRDGRTEDYLQQCWLETQQALRRRPADFDRLEHAHEAFMTAST